MKGILGIEMIVSDFRQLHEQNENTAGIDGLNLTNDVSGTNKE